MRDIITEITRYLLPFMVTAGDYALEVQKRIETQPEKSQFSDPGSQILTDADLTIQNYIETILLAKYPSVKFYGEEYQRSINQKYFKSGELEIWLDPIDGTLRYKKGHKFFSIVLTFVRKGLPQSCIWYMPAFQMFYLGSNWQGVKCIPSANISEFDRFEAAKLNDSSQRVLTYRPEANIINKLSGFTVVDLSQHQSADAAGMHPMAFSEYSAVVSQAPGVIDFLVAAYYLEWAGGVCTDLTGRTIEAIDVYSSPSYSKGVLAASTKEFHAKLLNALQLH